MASPLPLFFTAAQQGSPVRPCGTIRELAQHWDLTSSFPLFLAVAQQGSPVRPCGTIRELASHWDMTSSFPPFSLQYQNQMAVTQQQLPLALLWDMTSYPNI
jgi:hypothetical protein